MLWSLGFVSVFSGMYTTDTVLDSIYENPQECHFEVGKKNHKTLKNPHVIINVYPAWGTKWIKSNFQFQFAFCTFASM